MFWRSAKSREHDLDRELRVHLELEAEDQQDSGAGREQAYYAARRALGNITLTKEEVRRMWSWNRLEVLLQDLRYALRTLLKSPGFAITAFLTLALGIGASTAMFTVVDSVILKPLAFRDSGTLIVAWEHVRFLGNQPVGPNPRHVDIWRKRASAFSGLTLFRHMSLGLTVDSQRPRLIGAVGSLPNLFDVLQVQPALGRTFTLQDGQKGRDNVAILTHSLWQSQFNGDPQIIGKSIRLGDVVCEVVGVLPHNFHFPKANALRAFRSRQSVYGSPEPGVFIPAALDLSQMEWNGNYGNWVTVGRLNPGVTIGQAEAQLNTAQAQVIKEMSVRQGRQGPGALTASVQTMQEAVVGESRTRLWLLMAAVIGLMLIACLNLANAQLGRALSRRREAAVRTALGAARWRLVWNALAESLLLAALGGGAGLILAYTGLNLFRRYSPIDLPRLDEVHLNLTVLLFSIALTVAASVCSGVLPALRLLYSDPQASLQQNSNRSIGSRTGDRLRKWLIATQVFGCTALLLLTGLFSKSLLHLILQDKGFETGQVAVAEAGLSPKLYGAEQGRIAFMDGVLANLRALPGVQSAGLVSAMPLEGERWIEYLQRVDRPDQQAPMVNARWVSPGYFEATGQKLLAGRFFEERDRNLNSVVLSEGEAKALWGSGDPIGAQVKVLGRTHTVIGIVADSRSTSLKTAPAKMAYVHYTYRPPYTPFFIVRSAQAADTLLGNMRQAIWSYAPDVTIARVKTLDTQLADSLATERFQTFVLVAFGVSALLLAMLGVYGILSYSVATRRQEIGVRMALGATRQKIYGLTLAEVAVPVFGGLATGIIASMLAGRVIQQLLYGIKAVDSQVIVIVISLFLIASVMAAVLPARRAASVDPMAALRSE